MPIAIRMPPAGAASMSPRPRKGGGLVILLAVPLLLTLPGPPPAAACDWWLCPGPAHAGRTGPRAYAGRSPRYARRPGGAAWAYGYTSPARAQGYAYAPWSSTAIPPRPWYGRTALPVPNANAIGLTAPVATAEGLLEAGLPLSGPSLFGPDPPPPGWAYGYGGYGYGYTAPPSYRTPPADTPSWWVEPRRRR